MSSIFLPCFIAQTSDCSCCNAVYKVCLEGMKTKQKIWWSFFVCLQIKRLTCHTFTTKQMFVLSKLPTIEIIMKALTAIFVDLQLTYNHRYTQ